MQNDTVKMVQQHEPPAYQGSAGGRVAIRHDGVAASDEQTMLSAPQVLFCGGFHSSMLGTKASTLAEFCRARQWAFTRFDYRGHGESDGTAEEFTLHDWLDDTLRVLDSMPGPVVIVGSSMGSWLAMLAALRRPDRVHGLLLLAAAPDFLQELVAPRLGPAEIWDLQQDKVVRLENAYAEPHPLTSALLQSGRELSVLGDAGILSQLTCPIRLIHGTQDTDVPAELATRLLNAFAHDDARLTLLNRADHRLSDNRSLRFIEAELAELMERAATP